MARWSVEEELAMGSGGAFDEEEEFRHDVD